MPVLTQNMRFPVAVIALPDMLKPVKPCIHGRVDVRDICPVVALIMDQPGRIQIPDGLSRRIEILPHRGFISKGPHQDTRMIPVLLHHADSPVYICRLPGLFVVQPLVSLDPLESMRFQIRFVNYIETIFITQPVKIRHLRIMSAADGVDVITLHHAHMLLDGLPAYHRASRRTEIMHIDSVDHYRHAVYKEIRTFDLDPPEACNDLHRIQSLRKLPLPVQIKRYRIKRRLFRTPRTDRADLRLDSGTSFFKLLRPGCNLRPGCIRKLPLCPFCLP